MRVKVGDKWFICQTDQPIMIELEAQDKVNIMCMSPDATKYALFHEQDERTTEEKIEWMDK